MLPWPWQLQPDLPIGLPRAAWIATAQYYYSAALCSGMPKKPTTARCCCQALWPTGRTTGSFVYYYSYTKRRKINAGRKCFFNYPLNAYGKCLRKLMMMSTFFSYEKMKICFSFLFMMKRDCFQWKRLHFLNKKTMKNTTPIIISSSCACHRCLLFSSITKWKKIYTYGYKNNYELVGKNNYIKIYYKWMNWKCQLYLSFFQFCMLLQLFFFIVWVSKIIDFSLKIDLNDMQYFLKLRNGHFARNQV